MIPKIMALDTQILSKTKSGKVILAVVYHTDNNQLAKSIATKINNQHNGKVADISFNAVAISDSELLSRHDVGCVYVTPMDEQSIEKIASWATANSIASFSYNISDLDHGILASVSIERKTIIYVNKKALKKGNFRFYDTLFQIARLVE